MFAVLGCFLLLILCICFAGHIQVRPPMPSFASAHTFSWPDGFWGIFYGFVDAGACSASLAVYNAVMWRMSYDVSIVGTDLYWKCKITKNSCYKIAN